MKTRLTITIAALLMSMNATNASACGESLFHSGQGMRYHAFITRQPADILIYRPDTGNSNDSSQQLFAGLEKAGHHVTVISKESVVTSALMTHHFDVVIASVHDMDMISAHLDKSSGETALLAVIDSNGDTQADRFAHTVRENGGVTQYLRSIEQSMQKRGS